MRSSDFQRNLLPEIYPCHAVIGTVTEEAAKESGLCVGIPVVAGGLDAACAALGVGVLHDGETQEQGGQAGGHEYLHGSLLCRREADPRSPCCAGTLAASGG